MLCNIRAARLLKAEMTKRGFNYARLAEALAAGGHPPLTRRAIAVKVNRGVFSALFLLQCMEAMGVGTLHLD
jgi:hypothetical protein